MYAIIEDSGTQIKVASGDVVDVDLRDLGRRTKTVRFDRVLLLGDPEGDGEAVIGTPYVSGAAVTAEILGEVTGEKIDVIKYKRRKGYRRKQGHRQRYLRVKIAAIKSPSAPKPKSRTTEAKAAR
ncbi:MAG: 50S ribosomal protein L21 [Planctomycetes bacterium]|nr:50S ribosomal protein L21 [Planctomycetota bacterium]